MTSRPEIIRHTVGPEDEFLVLACDGLFDVMTNQKAVNFVRKTLEVRDLSYYLRITALCYLFLHYKSNKSGSLSLQMDGCTLPKSGRRKSLFSDFSEKRYFSK